MEDLNSLSDEELERIAAGEDFPSADVKSTLSPTRNMQKAVTERESPLDYLLNAAGLDLSEVKRGLLTNLETKTGSAAIGRGALPTIGSTIGASAGIPGMAAGGAAGESLRQILVSSYNPETTSPLQSAVSPLKSAGTEAALGGAFKGIGILKNLASRPAGQAIRGFTGIPTETAQAAVRDLGILFSLKGVKTAGKELEATVQSAAKTLGEEIITGAEGWKIAFKDRMFSPELAKRAADAVLDGEKLTLQEAYSARELISRALRPENIKNNPVLSENYRTYLRALNVVDDSLEAKIPGYAAKRLGYRNAIIRGAFTELLPQNANRTVSRLGMMLGVGAAAGSAATMGPVGLSAILPFLPIAHRAALMSAKIAGELAKPALRITAESKIKR